MKPISRTAPQPSIFRPSTPDKIARAQTDIIKPVVARNLRAGVQRSQTTHQTPVHAEPSLDSLCDELDALASTPLIGSEDLSPADRLKAMGILRNPLSEGQKKSLIAGLAAKGDTYVSLMQTRLDAVDTAAKAFDRQLTEAQRPARKAFTPGRAIRSLFHKPKAAPLGAHLQFDQNKNALSTAAWKVADQMDNLIVMLDGLGTSTSDLKEISQAMKGNMSNLDFHR